MMWNKKCLFYNISNLNFLEKVFPVTKNIFFLKLKIWVTIGFAFWVHHGQIKCAITGPLFVFLKYVLSQIPIA